MIAAIYARKSTEQQVPDDAKSVTRQIDLAREFATKQGWTVAGEQVYVDDGVSGAKFDEDRSGLAGLLLAAKMHAFGVVVAMDESRLGRDQWRTGWVLQQIADAGVQLWYNQDARQAKLDDAAGKFLESVRGFASEMEREKALARTREALRAKAKAGHIAGGTVYGYTNVRDGSNVKRIINEPDAQVVRRIFHMAAEGMGLLRIAKTLALKHRLAAVSVPRWFAEEGGLMSYSPRYADLYRQAATYVDKILKGAKPADLPVEQPTKFGLVTNMKTAKARGLTIPPSLPTR